MFTRSLIAAALIAVASLPASGEVYKWVDESGEVIYSDRPADDDAAKMAIDSRPTDNARISAEKLAIMESMARENEEQAKALEEAGKDRENEERMEENCRRAREAYASLQNAERLYIPLEDGERRYLSDDERQARLDRASNDVDEWCDR